MRKWIVLPGLALIVASLVVLIVLDSSVDIVILGSAISGGPLASGQFQRGNFTQGGGNFTLRRGNFTQGGGNLTLPQGNITRSIASSNSGAQSAFQSAFLTIYYRFTSYLVGIIGIAMTSLGIIMKPKVGESPAKAEK